MTQPATNPNANTHTQPPASAVAVAAAAGEAASGLNANLSQNNSGGQNKEHNNANGVFNLSNSAPSITSANTAINASFDKTLKSAGRTPVAEQVVFNIKTAIRTGNSHIEIQLDPVELGKLSIKMELSKDGKASGITVTADNKQTLDMLQRDARGLENALAEAGIKAESGSLSFNLRGGDQQQQEQHAKFAGYTPLLEEEDELAPLAVISHHYVVEMSDGLDIKI